MFLGMLVIFGHSGLFSQNYGASQFNGSVRTGSDSFVIANNGRQQNYQTGTVPASGVAIKNADMIQTGPGNYVEAQLDPSGAMIKLAENTSVMFNDLGTSSRPAMISFLYGRMRIMNQGGGGTVTVQAGNAAIEIGRGDIALDFMVIPGSSNRQPMLQISTLSGTASVTASAAASSGATRTPLYEHETVSFDVTTQLAVINRQPLNQEITAFWSRNGFRQAGTAGGTMLAQAPARTTQPALNTYQEPFIPRTALPTLGAYQEPVQQNYRAASPAAPSSVVLVPVVETGDSGQPKQAYRSGTPGINMGQTMTDDLLYATDLTPMNNERATMQIKNGGVLAGTILTALGIAGQGLAHFNPLGFDGDTADKIYLFSYAPIGAGIITLIATYFYLYSYR